MSFVCRLCGRAETLGTVISFENAYGDVCLSCLESKDIRERLSLEPVRMPSVAYPAIVERIARHHVYYTDDPDVLAKAIPLELTREWTAEVKAARLNREHENAFAPVCYAVRVLGVDAYPSESLVLYFERYAANLDEWFKEYGRLSVAGTEMLYDVIEAMHRAGIAHCDLHTKNVVVRYAKPDREEVRLIDFAYAVFDTSAFQREGDKMDDWYHFERPVTQRKLCYKKERRKRRRQYGIS